MECQTAVWETTSTVRSFLPYQSDTVIGVHVVAEFSATAERFANLSPFRRGLPICPGFRGGDGSYRAASNLRRVMKVIGSESLRQRSRSFKAA